MSGPGTGTDGLDLDTAEGRPAIVATPRIGGHAAHGWLVEWKPVLHVALRQFGSLLIRGLRIDSADAFSSARDALLGDGLPYREQSTPRSQVAAGVYTSTDTPPPHPIRLHNESSYVLRFPGILLFGCLTAPSEGGATTVGDSREVLARLDPALATRIRRLGWALLRNYHDRMSLSWQQSFGTDDRGRLEEYFEDARIAWRWLPDGGLLTSQRRAAVLRHPVSGEQSWFNHLAFWNRYTMPAAMRQVLLAEYGEQGLPYDTVLGDGTPLTGEEAAHLNEVYDGVLRRETYRAGDLLLVDNMLSCHGREPYRGDRRVLVAMADPRSVDACHPEVAPAPGPLPV